MQIARLLVRRLYSHVLRAVTACRPRTLGTLALVIALIAQDAGRLALDLPAAALFRPISHLPTKLCISHLTLPLAPVVLASLRELPDLTSRACLRPLRSSGSSLRE